MTEESPVEWQRYSLLLLAVLVAGVLLRVAGLRGDLWLDEITSLKNVIKLQSAMDIVGGLLTDNNHPVNSFYLYLIHSLGITTPVVMRLLSFCAGLGALRFAYLLSGRRGRLEQLFTTTIFSLSYILILYSSEARGYGLLSFFVLSALYCLKKYHEVDDAPRFLIGYALSCLLGIMSHFEFVQALIAFGIYELVLIFRSRTKKEAFLDAVRLNVIPLLYLLYLYQEHLFDISGGTGAIRSVTDAVLSTITAAFAGFELLPGEPMQFMLFALSIAFILLIAVFIDSLTRLKEGDTRVIIEFGAFIVAPLLCLLFLKPRVIYPRYFLVSIIIFYLAAGSFFARAFARGAAARVVAIALLGTFIFINAEASILLVKFGRGCPSSVVSVLTKDAQDAPVMITGDQQFRIMQTLSYYSGDLPIEWIEASDNSREAEWYIRHYQVYEEAGTPQLVLRPHGKYTLYSTHPTAPLSGIGYALYRRNSSV